MPIPADGSKFYVRASSGADIEVGELLEFDKVGGERSERDRTTLADLTDRKFGLGKKDNGSVSITMFDEPDDAGQQELDAAYDETNSEGRLCTWLKPDGKARQFTGLVKSFPDADGVPEDDDLKRTAVIRITGGIEKLATFTPATA